MRSLLCVWPGVLVLSASWFSVAGYAAEPAGPDSTVAATLVRQALEADLAGNKPVRESLLGQAMAAESDYAPARWHSGQLRYADRWLTITAAQDHAAGNQRLAEYRQLRDSAGKSLDAHLALARWCRRHQMKEHERFHWASVLNLQPRNEEAIAGLKLKKWRGMWLTLEEIERSKTLQVEADAAFEKWSAWIEEVQQALVSDDAGDESQAMGRLKALNDPAALPALAASLQKGEEPYCLAAIEAVSDMSEQDATDLLVWQAVISPHAKVRQKAAEALKPRPLHSYVPVLVGNLASPLELSPYAASYEKGQLFNGFVIRRDTPFAELAWSRSHDSTITVRRFRNGRMPTYNRVLASAARQSRNAARLQANAVQQVSHANQITEAENERIFAVLDIATGNQAEPVPQAWWRWWQDYNELDYPEYKPHYSYHRSTYSSQVLTGPPPARPKSCFIAGTLVWTETGLEPIEKLRPGDRVLSQDPQTGELAFKCIVETTLRPASPTFRVQVGAESLVATRGHPFWVAGKGWRMAKELQSSDQLYSVAGVTPLAQLAEGPDVEAHNLVIDDFGTYFVGKTGLLVRDNTLRELPTTLLPGLETTNASQP